MVADVRAETSLDSESRCRAAGASVETTDTITIHSLTNSILGRFDGSLTQQVRMSSHALSLKGGESSRGGCAPREWSLMI